MIWYCFQWGIACPLISSLHLIWSSKFKLVTGVDLHDVERQDLVWDRLSWQGNNHWLCRIVVCFHVLSHVSVYWAPYTYTYVCIIILLCVQQLYVSFLRIHDNGKLPVVLLYNLVSRYFKSLSAYSWVLIVCLLPPQTHAMYNMVCRYSFMNMGRYWLYICYHHKHMQCTMWYPGTLSWIWEGTSFMFVTTTNIHMYMYTCHISYWCISSLCILWMRNRCMHQSSNF